MTQQEFIKEKKMIIDDLKKNNYRYTKQKKFTLLLLIITILLFVSTFMMDASTNQVYQFIVVLFSTATAFSFYSTNKMTTQALAPLYKKIIDEKKTEKSVDTYNKK